MRRLLVALLLLAAPAAAEEVVAARTLRAGTVLAPADMQPAPGARNPSDTIARFSGQELRRAVYAGRPIRSGVLGPPTLVDRNDIVRMLFRQSGLGIRAEGRALDPGGQGERIRVLNLDSRQQVTATVLGPGVVEVAR